MLWNSQHIRCYEEKMCQEYVFHASSAFFYFSSRKIKQKPSLHAVYFIFTAVKLANATAHQRTIKTSKGSYLDLGYLKSISRDPVL